MRANWHPPLSILDDDDFERSIDLLPTWKNGPQKRYRRFKFFKANFDTLFVDQRLSGPNIETFRLDPTKNQSIDSSHRCIYHK
jgi:hypothetical protein